VGFARPDELHEQWVETEWFQWPGRERGVPLEVGVDGVVDSRLTGDPAHDAMEPWPRPFDPNMLYLGKTATGVHVPNDPFGGRNMYTSPINDVTPVEEQQTMLVRDREDKKAVKDGLLGTKDIKVHLTRRHCVQTTDKCDQILKPHKIVQDRKVKYSDDLKAKYFTPIRNPVVRSKPAKLALRPEDSKRPHHGTKRGTTVVPPPSSIQHHEPYHEDCPNVTLQARMRANDSDPPLNVAYGTYLRRSPEYGTRRGYLAGDMGPAPWRHTHTDDMPAAKSRWDNTHVADVDFERYQLPPTMITRNQSEDNYMYQKMVGREEYLMKNASRTLLTPLDHTIKNNTKKFRTGRVELQM
jgi:hypothetical protein